MAKTTAKTPANAKAKANTKPKAPRVKVPAHKSYMAENRANITNTVVGILRPVRNGDGGKTGFGELSVYDEEKQAFLPPKAIKMLYGKQARSFKRITEVITYTSWAKGEKKDYSYKYIVAKSDYAKQANK